jgi:hypothetical protein
VLTINIGKAPPLWLPDWHHKICMGQTTHQNDKSGAFDSVASSGPKHTDLGLFAERKTV